jgi:monoamine oxidase
MTDTDILIIGAGAAGLAAGMRLAKSHVSFQLIEARGRSGGRAFTQSHDGYPLDHGCGWLHSADRNPWRELAEGSGFTIDRKLPDWGKQTFDLGFSQTDQAAFAEASDQFAMRLSKVAESQRDRSAALLLEPANRWNPLIDAVSSYMSGAELNHISALDSARYADTEINWRIVEGYGTAITFLGNAANLPINYNCTVTEIDHSGKRLSVETSKGRIETQTVIITVPPSLLLSGTLRFRPELPEKFMAADGLPLGIADKLYIAIDTPEDLPVDGHLFGRIDRAATASYHLRPFGRALIEVYFGGTLAYELEQAGPEAFFAFACGELADLFGEAIRKRLHFLTSTGWAQDIFAYGSYSYARPGHADARQKLAESIDDRLFFAGEACSRHHFSTAHGAYQTGIEAANRALAATLIKAKQTTS